MKHTIEDRTIALAGVYQAAYMVDQIANQGSCNSFSLESSLKSLTVTTPENTLSVFGSNAQNLRQGLHALKEFMTPKSQGITPNALRYAISLLHIESRLRRQTDILNVIAERLDKLDNQLNHFEITHENIIKSLADIYKDTISTLKFRIQVNGNPTYLQNPANAEKIRAILLAGVRAAILWRQVGGRRWHLIFSRKQYQQACERLMKMDYQ
ncbi:high frequency lysogenization protein HflD [Litoribrevibacter euphylliae]|uniref:High frequency lysogenization protein HflD homolog n=1 Tax=Litoribrevibacter euphylliae TaxID=1834034 RepID=A0ABV7HG48_9GAMM